MRAPLNAFLLLLIVSHAFSLTKSDMRGTLLLSQTGTAYGEGFGRVLLQDLQTGITDTLIRSRVSNPCFSPDGRKVAYKDSATRKIHTIDIFTRQITDYNVNAGWNGAMFSWCRDGIYFANGGRYVFRMNLPAGTVDTIYRAKLTALIGSIVDTTKIDLGQGGVSLDGTRGAFTVVTDNSGSGNHVYTMDFVTGEEMMMNDGKQLSCQADISPDGLYCAHTNYTHKTGYINYFNIWTPAYQIWGGVGFWWFRYPINSSRYLFYRTISDSVTYLRDIDRFTNIRILRFPLSVFDAYMGGWVLDTLRPNPPSNLSASLITDRAITLAWNAPASGVAPTEYIVERDGKEIATVAATRFIDSALTPATSYGYTIRSRTIGVNFSIPLTGTFVTVEDFVPPSAIAAYSLGNSVDVVFSEAVDSVSAAAKANYSMDNSVSVISAALFGSNRVRLTTGVFNALTDSMITVTNVRDKATSPNATAGTSCPVTVVRDLWTTSGKGAWAYLDSGVFVWCDDDYPQGYFTLRSPRYNGLPVLQTSVGDGSTDSTQEFIRFTISRPMEIIVLSRYDSTDIQGWLKDPSWTKSMDILGYTYSKVFPAGTVSLKGNGHARYTTYNVILRNVDSTTPPNRINKQDGAKAMSPLLTLSPLPFSSQITLSCYPPVPGLLDISIFNMRGQRVCTPAKQVRVKGNYRTAWDGTDARGRPAPNGVYLCTVMLNGKAIQTERLVLVR